MAFWWLLGMMIYFNILDPSINQDRKIFISLKKRILFQICTQEIIRNIILPERLLNRLWRAPLNFSGSEKLKIIIRSRRKKRRKEKLTIVTNNREQILPIRFTARRGVTQNNELLIQVSRNYKSWYINE